MDPEVSLGLEAGLALGQYFWVCPGCLHVKQVGPMEFAVGFSEAYAEGFDWNWPVWEFREVIPRVKRPSLAMILLNSKSQGGQNE